MIEKKPDPKEQSLVVRMGFLWAQGVIGYLAHFCMCVFFSREWVTFFLPVPRPDRLVS